MYLNIILLPFLNFFLISMFGRFLGYKGVNFITFIFIGFLVLFSWITFYEIALLGSSCEIILCDWINSGIFSFKWNFLFDSLTVIMLIIVNTISFLVHIYSMSYMEKDPHYIRFMSYLSLFTFFMLLLVTSSNFIQLFLGWEGVGLCSYLLINFWYTRIQANKAAIKAMLVNRIGDIGLALGIFYIFYIFKTVDYAIVFSIIEKFKNDTITFLIWEIKIFNLICFFFLLAAVGKSAQLGLHTWLPDAMEGPTPVSALIHAATMVTAGIFLIVRCSPLFEYSTTALNAVILIGACTSFFAASTGLFQNDLKKVIAYSTCSQLGYMMFACGLSSYSAGMFHLYNHAFFKALLFMTAGSVIHALNDDQDMRRMGGLSKLLPFSFSMMLIGSLALMGFPFLSGFYSKDMILELSCAKYTTISHFSYYLGTSAAFITSFYSFRLLYFTFLTKSNISLQNFKNVHEGQIKLWLPLLILSFGSIFIGYLSKEMMIGLGTDFWNQSIYVHFTHDFFIEAEFLSNGLKHIPLILSLMGASSSLFLYFFYEKTLYKLNISLFGYYIYLFFNKKWFFDKVYNDFLVQNLLSKSYNIFYKTLDKGFFEYLGPYGLSSVIFFKAQKINKLQSGLIYHYTLIMFISISFFIFLIKNTLFVEFYREFILILFLILMFHININSSKDKK